MPVTALRHPPSHVGHSLAALALIGAAGLIGVVVLPLTIVVALIVRRLVPDRAI